MNTLICVYCGAFCRDEIKILEDHIKICSKHPMRKAEQTIKKLKDALIDLVGASEKQELEAIKEELERMPLPYGNDSIHLKETTLNAVNTLIEIASE